MAAKKSEHHPRWLIALWTYLGYGLLIVVGHIRDFFNALFKREHVPTKGFAPLLLDFEDFFSRRLYLRIQDGWNRPICSAPGAWIDVMERESTDNNRTLKVTGKIRRCFNLGSYNYLGFGDPDSPTRPVVLEALEKFSVSTTSARSMLGTTSLHVELEKLVARFVGKEDALVYGMGFGTNSTGIPALVGKGGLIISDENNHSSMVFGARSSGAVIKVFKHNDPEHLELVIRRAIIEGQPRTHRPWNKILVMVEGIYSMEGEICPLPEIVKVVKKYHCSLYVDEAHSIGALGARGRGVCEHTGVDPADVDILMGTFTKSFGSVGGYISGSKALIDYLRNTCAGYLYSSSISPPAARQAIAALKMILGEDGTDIGKRKIRQLHENANMVRQRLMEMGCHVLGDRDSPVVPMMLYQPAKITAFSRECFLRNLAVVVVGFPASPLLLARTRICISAAHTKEDLEEALEKMDEIIDRIRIRYGRRICG